MAHGGQKSKSAQAAMSVSHKEGTGHNCPAANERQNPILSIIHSSRMEDRKARDTRYVFATLTVTE